MADLEFEVLEGIGRISINRPDKRNALNNAVLEGIAAAVSRANTDPAIRLLTLGGVGDKAFCAGGDLQGMREAEQSGGVALHFFHAKYVEAVRSLTSSAVPVIGLANGDALAGGLGLLLACDLAVAAESAQFGLPEVNVGLFPMVVMSVLFKNIGRKRALELTLLGNRISAGQALEWGLLNRVFSKSNFEKDAAEFVRQFASKPGMVMRLGKSAYNAVDGIDPRTIHAYHMSAGSLTHAEDCREGIAAFLEKREPKWRHR
ncbi:MAG: enoyl-CoA hydratase/isomerase family protein [Nitrospirae bacterium]|nr:enoyl-CoA hydratase/isomerase family protein [Nitrospirota bacterium]